MEFKEFIQKLHPVIGAGSSTHAFTRSIVDAIVTDEGQAVLEEYAASTYKAYFNGNTGISKLAKKICAYIEPEEFAAYCEQFSDAAIQSLCDSFAEYLPNITPHNAGQELSALFALIIKDAASAKRKSTPKVAPNNSEKRPYDIISERILTTGQIMVEGLGRGMKAIAEQMESPQKTDAEAVDDEETSGAADGDNVAESTASVDTKAHVIKNATVVNQYGENCVHIDHVDTFKL